MGSCVSGRVMEITRMRIVALVLYSLAVTEVSSDGNILAAIPSLGPQLRTSSNGMCGAGWSYSYGSCYSPEQTTSETIMDANQACKNMDPASHMSVINTKQEMVANIEDGIFDDSEWICMGMTSDDNGTTWNKLDGSSEETYIETLRPFFDSSSLGSGDTICCYVYETSDASCYFYYSGYSDYYYCEKPGPYMNSGPCKIKTLRKPRKDATRKISFQNTKRDMCYIELWRSHFRPAQIKIYGYNFPSTSSTCGQGFFVQNNGKVLDYLLQEKLTCGNQDGPNGPMIRKRSGKGKKIRLYVAMNGDGRRVWLRTKGRSFRY